MYFYIYFQTHILNTPIPQWDTKYNLTFMRQKQLVDHICSPLIGDRINETSHLGIGWNVGER